MTSFNQQGQKVDMQVNVGNMVLHIHATPDIAALMECAVRSVQQARYDDAIKILDSLLQADDSIADAFYYQALALLKGRRPKLAVKSAADRIEVNLATAISLDPGQAHYYYLKALVKYDFYIGNGFSTNTGDIESLLAKAASRPVNRPRCIELLQHTNAPACIISQILQQRL